MANQSQHRRRICNVSLWPAALATVVLALAGFLTPAAQAQTFNVLHAFTDGADGALPYSGLTMDRAGRLYGTTLTDSTGGGTVFRLTQKDSSWVFAPLYHFTGNGNGAWPEARVVFGPDGTLYGTTQKAGGAYFDVVYNLRPSASACTSALCAWSETALYKFSGTDGYNLDYGDLIFDPDGNLYGTAEVNGDDCYGGAPGGHRPACERGDPGCGGPYGNVYKLTASAGGWTRTAVYSFTQSYDGAQPASGVIRDAAGNLYGTAMTCGGGPGCPGAGTVFQLTPAGSCFQEHTLYTFTNGADGGIPVASLIADAAGNFYGATSVGGSGGGGTVFELTPSNGGWTFQLLYSFTGSGNTPGHLRNLALDAAGNLYGTTYSGGAYGLGSVFKLTPGNGVWTYTSLHDFTNGNDGSHPYSNVVVDANGNLYGTASAGGQNNYGDVWEITP